MMLFLPNSLEANLNQLSTDKATTSVPSVNSLPKSSQSIVSMCSSLPSIPTTRQKSCTHRSSRDTAITLTCLPTRLRTLNRMSISDRIQGIRSTSPLMWISPNSLTSSCISRMDSRKEASVLCSAGSVTMITLLMPMKA